MHSKYYFYCIYEVYWVLKANKIYLLTPVYQETQLFSYVVWLNSIVNITSTLKRNLKLNGRLFEESAASFYSPINFDNFLVSKGTISHETY